MRTLLLYTGLLLSGTLPALAQTPSPWVEAGSFYGTQYSQVNSIQLTGSSGAWLLSHGGGGMGVAEYTIANTGDNGATWKSARVSYHEPHLPLTPSGVDYTSLWGVSAQEAWAVARDVPSGAYSLAHTTTGADGFAAAAAAVPGARLVRFFTATSGIVLAEGTTAIYRTSDGGQSWQPVPLSTPLALAFTPDNSSLPVSALQGQHFWVQTNTGQLAHTADAGLTWTLSPLPESFRSLTFRDALHGLAVATTTATLYRTEDGGLTWISIAPTGTWFELAMQAVPASPGTYLSSSTPGLGSSSAPTGTAISYDEGRSWQQLTSQQGVQALAADATGRVWGAAFQSHSATALRLAGTALATAPAQAAPDQLAYPNPTTGLLHLPAAGQFRQASVFDLAGRQCRAQTLGPAATTLDLSGLAPSLYVLRLAGGAGPARQQRITVVH